VASFLVALGVCPFTESVTASDERDPPLAELLEPLPHGWGRHALPEEKVDQLAFLARQIGDHRPGEIDDNGNRWFRERPTNLEASAPAPCRIFWRIKSRS